MKTKIMILTAGFLAATQVFAQVRSELYPANWDGEKPTYILNGGAPNNNGTPALGTSPASTDIKYLHDFSYAGYEKGEKAVPATVPGQTYTVPAQYRNGTTDATAAIQGLIDQAYAAGGGTVYLPEGTYLVRAGDSYALRITGSNILLKGDGIGKTFIYCDTRNMRFKSVITVGSGGNWGTTYGGVSSPLAETIGNYPTKQIKVQNASAFRVGDWIAIRNDRTQGWIDAHNAGQFWTPKTGVDRGVMFLRQITAINGNTITIDIPTRYWMHINDNARVHKVDSRTNVSGGEARWTMNTGLQDFSIACISETGNGWNEEDYKNQANGSYKVNNAFLIKYVGAVNCWLKNVKSYAPSGNAWTNGSARTSGVGSTNQERDVYQIHMPSNGLDINQSARVTIDNTDFSNPQYRGGGGNGYGINFGGQDVLVLNSSSSRTRHVYAFKYGFTNGNVIHGFRSNTTALASDFHMYLSMSNLIDCQTLNNDFIETCIRPYGGTQGDLHGHSSSQTVVWNTNAIQNRGPLVDSRQYGYGYVIGTRGTNSTNVRTTPLTEGSWRGVTTAPEDHREHIGNGNNLEPVSLYYDQLQKRLGSITPKDTVYMSVPSTFNSTTFIGKSDVIQNNGNYVGNLNTNGCYLDYAIDVKEAGDYTVVLNTASGGDSRTITVSVGGTNKGTITTPAGTDWTVFSPNAFATVNLSAGKQILRLTASGSVNIEDITIGKPIMIPGKFNATQVLNSSNISINATHETPHIGDLQNNSFFEYLIDVSAVGSYGLTLSTARSGETARNIEVSANGEKLSDIAIPAGTDWFAFGNTTERITLAAGTQILRFTANGSVNVGDITVSALTQGDTIVDVNTPEDGFVYNKQQQTPEVLSISIGNTILDKADYTVSYGANINAGTGTVIITGKNSHSGLNYTKEFPIVKKEILFTMNPNPYEVQYRENGEYVLQFPVSYSGLYEGDNLELFTLTNENGSKPFDVNNDLRIDYGYSSGEEGEIKIPFAGDYPVTLFVDGELSAQNYAAVFADGLILRIIDPNTPITKPVKSDNLYGIRFAQNPSVEKAEIFVNSELGIRNAELTIYDALGNLVFSENINVVAKGSRGDRKASCIWDLRNTAGRKVANGSYLVVVEAKGINGQRYRYSAKLGVKR